VHEKTIKEDNKRIENTLIAIFHSFTICSSEGLVLILDEEKEKKINAFFSFLKNSFAYLGLITRILLN
jgi:hypothetical protein